MQTLGGGEGLHLYGGRGPKGRQRADYQSLVLVCTIKSNAIAMDWKPDSDEGLPTCLLECSPTIKSNAIAMDWKPGSDEGHLHVLSVQSRATQLRWIGSLVVTRDFLHVFLSVQSRATQLRWIGNLIVTRDFLHVLSVHPKTRLQDKIQGCNSVCRWASVHYI